MAVGDAGPGHSGRPLPSNKAPWSKFRFYWEGETQKVAPPVLGWRHQRLAAGPHLRGASHSVLELVTIDHRILSILTEAIAHLEGLAR